MTEREYLEALGATGAENQYASMIAMKALEMAKSQGAKFDVDPVELPCLTTRPHVYGAVVELAEPRSRSIYTLSQEQAKEVVRRCEVLSKLRQYLKSLTPGGYCSEILGIIDGKST